VGDEAQRRQNWNRWQDAVSIRVHRCLSVADSSVNCILTAWGQGTRLAVRSADRRPPRANPPHPS
jgi:hypothetical protein